ncbi:hypothetical protein HNQ60_000751 [Povalibacter uvarum]|uniref:Uncharacterized protein n=1 Tax=Povalibacter uvarum TaxID=732238 RepID=A0A841HIM2_9GAMM|nr:hypothetical protein [Povalibacter uvarum]MBB6091905.1 hypothetical protein [Povalibacter uvarum]
MPDPVVPFYLDWKFWSFFTAALALLLSQLPPIHHWFRSSKIVVDTYTMIHVTHKIGNPNAQLQLSVRNTGRRTVRILGLELRFKRGDSVFVLPAINAAELQNDRPVMLGSFRLKVDEEWSRIVNFFPILSRQDDRSLRLAMSQIRADIVSKRAGLPQNAPEVAADQAVVAPLLAMFNSKFCWLPGEYDLDLVVKTEPAGVADTMRLRFTLFESDSDEMEKYAEKYQFGYDLLMNHADHQGILANISPRSA